MLKYVFFLQFTFCTVVIRQQRIRETLNTSSHCSPSFNIRKFNSFLPMATNTFESG